MFSTSSFIIVIASLLCVVSAAPTLYPRAGLPINLPAGVTPPNSTVLKYVYLGYGILPQLNPYLIQGTQNYTCNATSSTYSTSGTAEAVLLDITKYYQGSCSVAAIPPVNQLEVVGKHYYVPNPLTAGAVSPQFINLETGKFIIASRNASVASANPTYSVANVLLQNIQPGKVGGSLADWVVRTDVVGGVVPTILNTCKAGDVIAIPYKAHYLFYQNK